MEQFSVLIIRSLKPSRFHRSPLVDRAPVTALCFPEGRGLDFASHGSLRRYGVIHIGTAQHMCCTPGGPRARRKVRQTSFVMPTIDSPPPHMHGDSLCVIVFWCAAQSVGGDVVIDSIEGTVPHRNFVSPPCLTHHFSCLRGAGKGSTFSVVLQLAGDHSGGQPPPSPPIAIAPLQPSDTANCNGYAETSVRSPTKSSTCSTQSLSSCIVWHWLDIEPRPIY